MAAKGNITDKRNGSAQGVSAIERLLLVSVQQGKLELVKKILDKGASVNTADEVGPKKVVVWCLRGFGKSRTACEEDCVLDRDFFEIFFFFLGSIC